MSGLSSQGAASKRRTISVGVAELAVSEENSGQIAAYALGSCIGITVFDPVAMVGGVLNFMLPQPLESEALSGGLAKKPDAMFATTGIAKLFREVYKLGAQKERIITCAAGGAGFLNDDGHYQIGKRNKMIMRRLFWKNGITLNGEDTGGNVARTMLLDLTTGAVVIRSMGKEATLWSPQN